MSHAPHRLVATLALALTLLLPATLAAQWAPPGSRTPPASAPPTRISRPPGEAPTFVLAAGGVGGGLLGLLAGGAAGAALQMANGCGDEYLCGVSGAALGALVGETLGVPIGVHLANGRTGSVAAGIGASALVTVAGLATGVALASVSGEESFALVALAVPALQVYRSIRVERRRRDRGSGRPSRARSTRRSLPSRPSSPG